MEYKVGWHSNMPILEKQKLAEKQKFVENEIPSINKIEKKTERGNLRITELGSEAEKSDSENK